MKISIIMKPKDTGIWSIFEQSGYKRIAFWHWTEYVGQDLYIDEVPREKLEEVYNKLKTIPVSYKVILAVRGAFLDTGEEKKKTSYFEDVERMILNAHYE